MNLLQIARRLRTDARLREALRLLVTDDPPHQHFVSAKALSAQVLQYERGRQLEPADFYVISRALKMRQLRREQLRQERKRRPVTP